MTPWAPFESRESFEEVVEALTGDADPLEIARMIHTLPSLALRVLDLANRSRISGSMSITRVDRALLLVERPRLIVLATQATEERQDVPEGLDAEALRSHLTVVAEAASIVAVAARLPLEEEARAAGLLHDIGIVAQMRSRPREFSTAMAEAADGNSRLIDHERLHCATDHCEVAEDYLRGLGLPETLAAAVGYHHDPLAAPSDHRYLTILLYAAECLAWRAGYRDGCADAAPHLESRILAELRLTPESLEMCIPVLERSVGRPPARASRNPTRMGVPR